MKLTNRNKTAEALAIERDEEKLHFLEKRDEKTRTKTKPIIPIEKLQQNKKQISAILFALIVVSQILGLFHSTSKDSDSQLLDQQLQLQSKIQSQSQTHLKNVFRVTPLSPECLTHVQAKESEDPLKAFKKNCLFLPPPEEIVSKCPSEDLTKHMASFHKNNNNKSETDNLQKYVMFVNTGHSGHSLVGSLLDAHPNMLVSHEGDMFARYTGIGMQYKDKDISTHLETREEIFDEIFSNSLKCALYSRFQNYYNYTVPNGWNGVWIPGELYVIGDKKGGHAFRQLNQLLKTGNREKMVQTFQEFQKTIDLPIHVINVFWNKKSRVYKQSHDIIEMLRQDMPPHLFSTTDWDNNVYTCGEEASRRSLFLETCNALGVPCDSNILDMWSSMAECKKAKKHLKWWHK